jgi:cation-transporting ATPase E
MTPINTLTTTIPAFFLALQPNYTRPAGKFLSNIFEHAFPAGLTIVFNTLYLQLAGYLFDLPPAELSTMMVLMAGVVGFFLLVRVAHPMNRFIQMVVSLMAAAFVALFLLSGTPLIRDYFMLESVLNRNVFFYLPLFYFSFHIHGFLGKCCRDALAKLESFKNRRQADEDFRTLPLS